MKKKGLIVATIVMVLVLAVSLTTATYAWFSTSDVTKIDAFEVKVVSNNAVNIGVKAECVHESSVIDDDFYTGTVEYQHGTDGVLGGTWTGSVTGLSSTIDHNINWETQKKAVGVVTGADNGSTVSTEYGTLKDKYSLHTDGSALYTMNAANKGEESALVNVTRAKANYTPDSGENTKPGDYVYLFLGASPTKDLETNQLIIMIDGTKSPGQNVGILASIHVAYRITKAGASQVTTAWTEVDVFAQVGATNQYHYNDKLANVQNNLTEQQLETYVATYGGTAPETKAYALVIDGLSLAKDAIDQIEIVIYMCGSDGDCIDAGLGTGGNISIFFHTVTDTSANQNQGA